MAIKKKTSLILGQRQSLTRSQSVRLREPQEVNAQVFAMQILRLLLRCRNSNVRRRLSSLIHAILAPQTATATLDPHAVRQQAGHHSFPRERLSQRTIPHKLVCWWRDRGRLDAGQTRCTKGRFRTIADNDSMSTTRLHVQSDLRRSMILSPTELIMSEIFTTMRRKPNMFFGPRAIAATPTSNLAADLTGLLR